MPLTETAVALVPLTGFILLPIAIGMGSSITAKGATDRIASFLPTATVSAYQLILSSYDAKEECTVGQVCILLRCAVCHSVYGQHSYNVKDSSRHGMHDKTPYDGIASRRGCFYGSPCPS